jgi:Ca-activated chloride channel family protein
LITTGLNDEILRTIAIDTDGQYIRMDDGSVGIAPITDEIAGMEKKTLQTHEYAGFEDRYQYFATIALILFLIEPLISTRKREEREWRGRYV